MRQSEKLIRKKISSFLESQKNSILNDLSLGNVVEIYTDLVKGATLSETAHRIIREWLPSQSARFKSIISDLATFKIKLIKPADIVNIQAEKKQDVEAKIIKEAYDNLTSRIDGMGRLGWLIDVQTERVHKALKLEGKMVVTTTNEAVKQLGTLLEKYINFQIETGIEASVPQEHVITIDNRVNAFLDQTVRDSADDMAMAASRLIEAAQQKAINMDLNKSGKYTQQMLPETETEIVELVPVTEVKVEQR